MTRGNKFGDLIIWKEMIEKAKAEKRPIIFVTDDGKSDWWHIHSSRQKGRVGAWSSGLDLYDGPVCKVLFTSD